MRTLIYGTGGVGAYLGAKLSHSGHDTVFVARGNHLFVMQQQGLLLESPEGDLRVRASFVDSPAGLPPFDLIIMAMKSFDTADAAINCRSAVGEATTVLTIQNGVENIRLLQDILGKERVIGGSAYIFSTIGKPGVVRHHGGTTRFRIGETGGSASSRITRIADAMNNAGIVCEIVNDIGRVMWEKFIFICGAGGMTAYTRRSVGAILDDAASRDMLSEVFHEAAQVGRAMRIDGFEGLEEKLEANLRRMPPSNTSSMYYDLTHGKRIEVEALNGAIVRFARECSVEVPENRRIFDSLLPYASKRAGSIRT
jgi:2-dehydropantoate 2-reductase